MLSWYLYQIKTVIRILEMMEMPPDILASCPGVFVMPWWPGVPGNSGCCLLYLSTTRHLTMFTVTADKTVFPPSHWSVRALLALWLAAGETGSEVQPSPGQLARSLHYLILMSLQIKVSGNHWDTPYDERLRHCVGTVTNKRPGRAGTDQWEGGTWSAWHLRLHVTRPERVRGCCGEWENGFIEPR